MRRSPLLALGSKLSQKTAARIFLGALFGVLASFSNTANAVVKVTAVGNASRFTDLTNVYTVYGGLAGALTEEKGAPVNNCVGGNGLTACNETRVYPNLILSITFTAEKDGIPLLMSGGTTPQVVLLENPYTTAVTKGSTITLNVRWGNICTRMADSASTVNNTTGTISALCDFGGNGGLGAARADFKIGVSGAATGATADQTLSGAEDDAATVTFVVSNSIGQDTNGVSVVTGTCDADPIGLCHFEITAGDQKVVIKNLEGRQGFPIVSGTGVPFEKVRVFWQEIIGNDTVGAFTSIRNNSPFADVTVTSDGSSITATPTRLEGGLENDHQYAFKAAVIDSTGNIGYFTPNDTSPGDHTGDTYCAYSTDPTTSSCHIAKPGEVVGVLSKDLNCFIATAAYGSQMAPQVEIFRRFRDLYLKPTAWGSAFVRYYYQHSPKYAHMISESPVLRAASRALLWPLLAYAKLSLTLGAFPAFFLFFALFAFPVAYFRQIRRQDRRENRRRAGQPIERRPRA